MLRRIRRLFWCWVPHTCRFRPVQRFTTGGELLRGSLCRRCGTVVWFNVKG